MAFAIGIFIGYFFFAWIRAVFNKLDHSSGMIQIVLSLCCAYVSFIVVEGMLHLSGVLATVAASLVLAHHMWPYVASEESMHHVWHTFESLGNIIVFFLAGSITGYIVVEIDPMDFLHLLVIYIVLLCVRGSLIFGSRPILRYLHADKLPVTWQDATLMTWGGLRGAVGLALAIQVNNDRAPLCLNPNTGAIGDASCKLTGAPQIDPKDAQRLLFFVSGIAFLTTLVNATTAPMLVQKLGITACPAARQTMMKMFHQQLVNWSEDSNNPPEVTASLREMLHEAAHHIDHQQVSLDGPQSARSIGDDGHGHGHAKVKSPKSMQVAHKNEAPHQSNTDLVVEYHKFRELYSKVESTRLGDGVGGDIDLLGGHLPTNMMGKVDDMVELIKNEECDIGMAKVVNHCFLTLVYNNYWKLIERGKLRPGGPESEVLLTSVRISLSPYHPDLKDFVYVHDKMIGKEDINDDEAGAAEFGALSDDLPPDAPKEGCLPSFVGSWKFNLFIFFTILCNSVMVAIEELGRTEDNKDLIVWILMDSVFTTIFVGEFLLKFVWLRCSYYKDAWNRFDFFLVIVGVFGLVMSLMTRGGGAELAGQTRVLRLARVLRTMRFLRVFRLFNARLHSDKFVSLELAKLMKKITTMSCFIEAHFMAQNDLIKYFGGNGKIDEKDEAEIARCILQSQVSTYQALIAAATTQRQLGVGVLHEMNTLYQRKQITEGLSAFVEKAHADGAITATEAHAILHPLNHQVSACMKTLSERAEGVVSRSQTEDFEAVASEKIGGSKSSNAYKPAGGSIPEAPPLAPAGSEVPPLAPEIPAGLEKAS